VRLIICRLLYAYLIIVFGRIILSWFPVQPGSPVASVFGFLYTITEPVLGPIRRVIPPMGMGGMGFDFSPLIVILGISLLQTVIC